jgi:2-oxoglutarate dehydrogenase E1 component
VEAARLAIAYRHEFQRDFLIDLVGYRRHGHNEGDEPAFTQPLMYQKIAGHPTVRALWARTLIERGVIDPSLPDQLVDKYNAVLQAAMDALQPEQDMVEPLPAPPPPGAASSAQTAVPLERLGELNAALLRFPAGFSIHRKLERGRERRAQVFAQADERTIDWSTAEELAFASILADGVSIRLTGEDVERGTFSHRHAVFHDVKTGGLHVPLQSLPQARAGFEIHNSPLSENAALGFEYGYNVQEPSRLVIWEAQYGDFINGAQVIIDEFIVSARIKWGSSPRSCCCCRTRTKARARITRAHGRALPPARRRHQHADRQLHHRRAVLPSSAPAGGAVDQGSAAAGRAHAEEFAAAPDGRVGAARARRVTLPHGHRRRRCARARR